MITEIFNPVLMKALAEIEKTEEPREPEWIPGDCETCGFNDGSCYGRCIWDEHLEFDPYEAIMILVERGKEQA